MARKEPYDFEDRIGEVQEERGGRSIAEFVGGLDLVDEPDPVEQNRNEEYMKTIELYGDDYAPFLFTKGMPLEGDGKGDRHDEGIVPFDRKRGYYQNPVRLGTALEDSGQFERGGVRPFIGVPGVYSIGLQGMDSWRGIMPPAPDPTGPINAMEMIDTYAMEQLRDVPFTAWPNEYGSDGDQNPPISDYSDPPEELKQTVEALTADFERAEAESLDWWYSPDRLFVEDHDETLESWGPYVSQFLLHDIEMWALPCKQEYLRYRSGTDYNVELQEWLDTLEGQDEIWAEGNPKLPPDDEDNDSGYISTPRHLATIVNAEPPYQEYFIAALRLLGKVEFDHHLPYAVPDPDGDEDIDINVFDYTDGGPVGLFDVLARVCRQALLAAFYQKYYVHFRCRPETYAGRLHAQRREGCDFGIHDLLTGSELLDARPQETDLLSTAYVEGSPVHPAYPSGHSVIAGACGTVLKTWFRDAEWPSDLGFYVPEHKGDKLGVNRNDMGVPDGHRGIAQEVDKLVSNVGLARMFAGVHYYTDHYQGVKLGEQVAVGVMADILERAYEMIDVEYPQFTPYLEYDVTYPANAETLEQLRGLAAERDTEFLKQ